MSMRLPHLRQSAGPPADPCSHPSDLPDPGAPGTPPGHDARGGCRGPRVFPREPAGGARGPGGRVRETSGTASAGARVRCGRPGGPAHQGDSALRPATRPCPLNPRGSRRACHDSVSQRVTKLLHLHEYVSPSTFGSACSFTRSRRRPVKGSPVSARLGGCDVLLYRQRCDGHFCGWALAPADPRHRPGGPGQQEGRPPDRDRLCTLPTCPVEVLAEQHSRVGGTLPSTVPHAGSSDSK